MIPYFGPFIGAVPAVIITLFSSLSQALWLILIILIIQQLDGIVIGPKILGGSVGISPFWIITAITLGGSTFGIIGMIVGVPVITVSKRLFERYIDKQIDLKQADKDKKEEQS